MITTDNEASPWHFLLIPVRLVLGGDFYNRYTS